MIIKNKNIKLEIKNNLIHSIKYKNQEILNETKKWKKKFPILFPAIGRKKEFKINDKTYFIQKHGFWNNINFNIKKNKNSLVLKGKMNRNKKYPILANIKQKIQIKENKIKINTEIKGDGYPIHFGYHPAFSIDLGNLKLNTNAIALNKEFNFKKTNINIKNIYDLPWKEIDTFIIKSKELILENKDYDLKINTNMKYIAIWTNQDKYVCLEPWSNLPATIDPEDNSILKRNNYNMTIEILEKEKNDKKDK